VSPDVRESHAITTGSIVRYGHWINGSDVGPSAGEWMVSLFLAAPRSGFLTGVCLEVDGGRDIE